MSLGYFGYCKKILEDDIAVYYAYSGVNLNDPDCDLSAKRAYDGAFAVDKSIMNWIPAKPNQTGPIYWAHAAIENGQAVVITECKNAFKFSKDIDYIAEHLLFCIFEHLHETGTLPESETFGK